MNPNSGRSVQSFFAYLAYLLSGFFIFNPLNASGNIILSLFISFLTAVIIFELLLFCFSKERVNAKSHEKFKKAICIFTFIFSTLSTLLLITEVIQSVAFITNRNISTFYYVTISSAVLLVSLHLCIGKEKGIYRFCNIASVPIILLCLSAPLAFITTRGAAAEFDFAKNASTAIKSGTLSGLFLASDTALYFFTFTRFVRKENSYLSKGTLRLSFICSYFLIVFFSICTKLTFSDALIQNLRDPSYSLIKLIPGIDFTEFLSCVRIISFMIKSSVYIYTSAASLQAVFGTKKLSSSAFSLLIYLSVPIIFIAAMIANRHLPYGAFQEYVYIPVCSLSLLFLLLYTLFQKKCR